jgi:hypothetical protein
VTREEAQGVQTTTPSFEVGATGSLVACLGVLQDGGDALQVGSTGFGIKPQRGDQPIGGVADLAQRDRWVFPPAAAGSGGLRRDD